MPINTHHRSASLVMLVMLVTFVMGCFVDETTVAETNAFLDDDPAISVAADPVPEADALGLHLRVDAGVNFARVRTASGVARSSFSNVEIDFDPGVDLEFGIGLPLGASSGWSIEVMTGITINAVDSISGQFASAANPMLAGTVTGGSGDLYQVPIVANLQYRFDLSETMTLGLLAGFGGQYSDLEVDDVRVLDPRFPGGVEVGGTSSSGWAFRYQFGLDLSWSLSSRTSLGLNVRYAGTTDLNGGSSSSADFDAKSFQNLAMGITFSLAF